MSKGAEPHFVSSDETLGDFAVRVGVGRRSVMSTVAVPHPSEEAFSLTDWVREMIVYAIGLGLSALLLGGVLNMSWNELAGAFSFMEPLGSYWACVIAVLGAYGAYLVYDSARAHRTTDIIGDFNGSARIAGKAGILLLLAWVVSEFLA